MNMKILRSWNPGDPEPADHPDVIDAEGDTWAWEPYDEEGLALDPLQPGEAAGGWWLKTGPYRGGGLWPWDEVTEPGTVHEAGEETDG